MNKLNFETFGPVFFYPFADLSFIRLSGLNDSHYRLSPAVNLESRLDVIAVRLGFADCLDNSRELIKKGCVLVDNKAIYKSNFIVKVGQVLATTVPIKMPRKNYS